jgi:hypothetical protein
MLSAINMEGNQQGLLDRAQLLWRERRNDVVQLIEIDCVDVVAVDHSVVLQTIVRSNRHLSPDRSDGPSYERNRRMIAEPVRAVS